MHEQSIDVLNVPKHMMSPTLIKRLSTDSGGKHFCSWQQQKMKSSTILIAVISSFCLCLAMPAEKRNYGYSGGNYNYRPAYAHKPIYIPKPVMYEQPIYIDKPYPVYKPHPQVMCNLVTTY